MTAMKSKRTELEDIEEESSYDSEEEVNAGIPLEDNKPAQLLLAAKFKQFNNLNGSFDTVVEEKTEIPVKEKADWWFM